jgi:hypothetical protein
MTVRCKVLRFQEKYLQKNFEIIVEKLLIALY